MNITRARLLSLALALLLLLSAVPFAALADEEVEPAAVHTHTYATSYGNESLVWYDNVYHANIREKYRICSCGYSETIREVVSKEAHSPVAGSRTYVGSRLGDEGGVVNIYEYTCITCGGKFTKQES